MSTLELTHQDISQLTTLSLYVRMQKKAQAVEDQILSCLTSTDAKQVADHLLNRTYPKTSHGAYAQKVAAWAARLNEKPS